MARTKRANGAGSIYIKHGAYYGRWRTVEGGQTNRRLGPVRRPGTREGLTHTQAEKQLRELMQTVQVTSDPERTMAIAGQALLARLEAKNSSRSHLETVESHLRVRLVPFFRDKPLDRITDTDVTRLLVRLNRLGRKPKTIRNIASTLHSVFELAIRRRWVGTNPCKLVDLPAVPQSTEVRFLTQEELMAVVEHGVSGSPLELIERPLYLMAAMTGLRQGELLGLRWIDLDLRALKVRVRQAYVRGEFKPPKSRRGFRGVPLAERLVDALQILAEHSEFIDEDDLVFGHPDTGDPLDRSTVRKRFRKACTRATTATSKTSSNRRGGRAQIIRAKPPRPCPSPITKPRPSAETPHHATARDCCTEARSDTRPARKPQCRSGESDSSCHSWPGVYELRRLAASHPAAPPARALGIAISQVSQSVVTPRIASTATAAAMPRTTPLAVAT